MTREEAIKVVKESMHFSYDDGNIFEALKTLVPELRESEDERIRKELLEVIRHCYEDGGYTLCTDDYKKYSTYLEKLKEQEIVEAEDICVRKMVDKYRCTEEYDNEGNLKGKPVNCMIRAYEQGIRDILKIVKQKPKAEWSEEDEQFLLVCKNALQKYQSSDKWDAAIIYSWLEKRLKSFYLQPHWKPSEKQMSALDLASLSAYDDEDKETLKSLHNDLQKL